MCITKMLQAALDMKCSGVSYKVAGWSMQFVLNISNLFLLTYSWNALKNNSYFSRKMMEGPANIFKQSILH